MSKSKPRIGIPHPILREILMEAEERTPNETGGVLVGRKNTGDGTIVITAAIGPGPNSLHAPEQFVPDSEYQYALLDQLYADSNGVDRYLGDWHTHPGGSLALSRRDKETLKKIALYGPAQTTKPLMMIVSGGPEWDIAVWQWQRRFWKKTHLVERVDVNLIG